jgi:GNAT superfamily N-acetyltransferase
VSDTYEGGTLGRSSPRTARGIAARSASRSCAGTRPEGGEDGRRAGVDVLAAEAQHRVPACSQRGVSGVVRAAGAGARVTLAVDLDARSGPAEVDLDVLPVDVEGDVRERGREAAGADEREEAILEIAPRARAAALVWLEGGVERGEAVAAVGALHRGPRRVRILRRFRGSPPEPGTRTHTSHSLNVPFQYTIRTATRADIPAVLELWEQARSGHAQTKDTPHALERLLATDSHALLIAGEVDGVLIAAFDGWRGNLYRLAVKPGKRRAGIARALVEAGEARLRSRGAPKATALVGRGDEAAEGLWRAAGYADDRGIGRWVRSL